MHEHYVALLRSLHDYGGDAVARDVLRPWLSQYSDERHWLTDFGKRRGTPVPAADQEDSWRLYGLSRIAETLVLRFQPEATDSTEWNGPDVTIDEVIDFFDSLGLHAVLADSYSPFRHEIVRVCGASHPDQPVGVIKHLWPCLMLGPMLLLRSGVEVLAGANVLTPDVAENATLYWAYRRKNRRCEDLSHGWGSNSQWRTAFRRDYCFDGQLYLNVDGAADLSTAGIASIDGDGLSRAERIELLVHRHFVKTSKPDTDLWPYDIRMSLPDDHLL